LKVPKGLAAQDPKSWLRIDYHDSAARTDLWNMLPFSISSAAGQDASEGAVTAKVNGFLAGSQGYDPRLAMWLERLVTLANMLDYSMVFGEEVLKSMDYFKAIWNNFNDALKKCPEGYDCEGLTVSGSLLSQIAPLGVSLDASTTYAVGMFAVWGESTKRLNEISGMIAARQATDDEIEAKLESLDQLLQVMKNVVLEFLRRVDEAQKEAEEYANARDNIGRDEKHIWEIIPDCLNQATVEKFKNSLHDWWGIKKYVMLAISALVNIPIIIASAGLAIIGAVVNFAMDFISLMVGGSLAVLKNFGECLIRSAI
jgi:hypothetical protein